MKQIIKKSFLFLLAFAFLIVPFVIFAACDGADPNTIGNPLCGISDFPSLIGKVVEFVQGLVLILAPIFIVWAGITFITSGGDPTKIKKGREIILYAVIGIIVTLLAKPILEAVMNIFKAP